MYVCIYIYIHICIYIYIYTRCRSLDNFASQESVLSAGEATKHIIKQRNTFRESGFLHRVYICVYMYIFIYICKSSLSLSLFSLICLHSFAEVERRIAEICGHHLDHSKLYYIILCHNVLSYYIIL